MKTNIDITLTNRTVNRINIVIRLLLSIVFNRFLSETNFLLILHNFKYLSNCFIRFSKNLSLFLSSNIQFQFPALFGITRCVAVVFGSFLWLFYIYQKLINSWIYGENPCKRVSARQFFLYLFVDISSTNYEHEGTANPIKFIEETLQFVIKMRKKWIWNTVVANKL